MVLLSLTMYFTRYYILLTDALVICIVCIHPGKILDVRTLEYVTILMKTGHEMSDTFCEKNTMNI